MGLLDSVTGAIGNAADAVSDAASSAIDAASKAVTDAVAPPAAEPESAAPPPPSAQVSAGAAQAHQADLGAQVIMSKLGQMAGQAAGGIDSSEAVRAEALVYDAHTKMSLIAADAYMKKGDIDAARHFLQPLQKEPFASRPADLLEEHKNKLDAAAGGGGLEIRGAGPNVVQVRADKGAGGVQLPRMNDGVTVGDVAGKRLAQCDQLEGMNAALPAERRPANPHDPGHVKAYFQQLSQGKGGTTDKVRDEWGKYLSNFYVHPGAADGGGVRWEPGSSQSIDTRSQRAGELLRNHPADAAGRKLVNCEMYADLTKNVLGGLKGADGKPRFDVVYGATPSHVVTGVYERGSGGKSVPAFTVNNHQANALTKDQRDILARLESQAKGPNREAQLQRQYLNMTLPGAKVGSTPSAAGMTKDRLLP